MYAAAVSLSFTDRVSSRHKNGENEMEQMKNAQAWENDGRFYQCLKYQLEFTLKPKNAIDYDLSLSHQNLLFPLPEI